MKFDLQFVCVRTYAPQMNEEARKIRDALRYLLVTHGVMNEHTRPCGTPLTMPHAHALLELLTSETALSIGQLSTALNIDRTNVSRLCQRMEESGEIESEIGSDARVKLVRLTPHGRSIAQRVDVASAQHFEAVVERLGRPVDEVIQVLDDVRQAIVQKETREKK